MLIKGNTDRSVTFAKLVMMVKLLFLVPVLIALIMLPTAVNARYKTKVWFATIVIMDILFYPVICTAISHMVLRH